jgi:hypothetical protein
MLIRTFIASLIATMFLLVAPAQAEVRDLTPEELQARATTIVIGTVLGNYERDAGGRRTAYITQLRVLESLKGDAEVGEEITGSWYHNAMMPMTTGTAGHRGTLPEVGSVVKVHIDDRGRVLLPNGFQPADPRLVTDELLAEGNADAIRAACAEAGKNDLFREMHRGYQHLKEQDLATTEDLVMLAGTYAAIGDYEQSIAILKPIATGDENEQIREQAQQFYLRVAWSLGDDAAYMKAIDELIESSRGEMKKQMQEYRAEVEWWFGSD